MPGFDDFQKDILRRTVPEFFDRGEYPTLPLYMTLQIITSKDYMARERFWGFVTSFAFDFVDHDALL